MKIFTDAAGRAWTITLSLGTALAVKDKLGIDLLQPEQGRAFKPSDFDPCLPPAGRQAFGPEHGRGSEAIEVNRENIGLLKEAFMKNHHTDRSVRTEGGLIQSR